MENGMSCNSTNQFLSQKNPLVAILSKYLYDSTARLNLLKDLSSAG